MSVVSTNVLTHSNDEPFSDCNDSSGSSDSSDADAVDVRHITLNVMFMSTRVELLYDRLEAASAAHIHC